MVKYYIVIMAVVFVIFLYNSITYRKRERERLRRRIRDNWGKIPDREYTYDEFDKITFRFLKSKDKEFHIDDITWNDLDMDSIFKLINNTYSSTGEEYLYKMLRIPVFDRAELNKREKLIRYFEEYEEEAFKLQEIYAGLGRTRSISLTEFLNRIMDVKRQNLVAHFMCIILFITAVALLFIQPVVGIAAFFTVLIINIGSYYSSKAEIESYFVCFKYLVDMINCSKVITAAEIEGIAEYCGELNQCQKKLEKIRKGSFWISMNGNSGSIGEIIMEYVRMIFHVDIIKFNLMLTDTIANIGQINDMFDILGRIESAMAVASFRKAMLYYCLPEFNDRKELDIKDIYHPMISEPVANDISEKISVLITGSNASGKSTFLKTIAINSILAQTINTCTAKVYRTCFYKTYTSMALRDDLMSNESYFIVEIKSLKRIMDAVDGGIPVLCFVDEVLRGTNTVERIAASSHILNELQNGNAMCFAATHDIELTNILENIYSNYHFTEEVKDDDVLFNYKLLKGRATSRNAIKLLNVIGFDKNIVKNAENMAERFIKTGVWSM